MESKRISGWLLAVGALLAWQQASATGTAAGEIDGRAFTAPVECEFPNETVFSARTPGMPLAGASRSDVVPAVGITLWAGQLGVTIFVDDQQYQFSAANQALSGRTLRYAGTIASRQRGSYAVRLAVDCAEPS